MQLRAATLADLPTTVQISMDAFAEDGLYQAVYPHKDTFPTSHRAALLLRQKFDLALPSTRFIVAETEATDSSWSGKPEITGYAIWERLGKQASRELRRRQPIRKRIELFLLAAELSRERLFPRLNPSFDRSVQDDFDKACHQWFAHFDDCWHLGPIAISPNFQKQGVGSLLVAWGVKQADEDRVPITLESAPDARSFYSNRGFRVFDTFVWNGHTDQVFVYEPAGVKVRKRQESDRHGSDGLHPEVIVPC